MKASDFLQGVLSRSNVEIDSETQNEIIQKFAGVDVPDKIVEPVLNNIITKDAAAVDKDIASKHKTKIYDNLTKAQTNALLAAGYSQDEVSIINNMQLEDRISKIVEINTNKVTAKFSASETEQIALAKAQAEAEKTRADSYQEKLLKKDEDFRKQQESLRSEFMLDSLVEKISYKKDGIPVQTAINVMKSELKSWLNARSAQIIFVEGRPKIVSAQDPTEDFYDENNKPILVDRLLIRIAQSQNLVDNKVQEPKPNPGNSSRVIPVRDSKTSAKDYFNDLVKKRYGVATS